MSKKVIITPLNWGLGHATRCIPIIQHFHDRQFEVILCGNGPSLDFLKSEFPQFTSYKIRGAEITYSTLNNQSIKIALQVPKFISAIEKEQADLKKVINLENPDLIISDNRYGCFDDSIPSVIITHQLKPLFPIFKKISQGWIDHQLSRFKEVWIPDTSDHHLSGLLSTNDQKFKSRYLGPLSSLSSLSKKTNLGSKKILGVLSGPEPQRTIFHKALIEWSCNHHTPITIVGNNSSFSKHNEIEEKGFLPPKKLYQEFQLHGKVICRSGYSSIMDLAFSQHPILTVPTPGQAEQEYLANYLSAQYNIPTLSQKSLPQTSAIFKTIPAGQLNFYTHKKSLNEFIEQAFN